MDIQQTFLKNRALTKQLCQSLNFEDCVAQPVEFVSPPKWHLAHTSWFFEAFILEKYVANYQPYNQDFFYLFNSYYNALGERTLRAKRGDMTRPGLEKIYAYRDFITHKILDLLDQNNSQVLIDLVILGINHEQQHQELLLTDIKYILGHQPTFPIYQKHSNLMAARNASSNTVLINSGVYEVGYKGDGFCYDHERGAHQIYLDEYEINNHLVTNEEFIAFIEAGGYEEANFWLEEGWLWRKEHQIKCPLYWHQIKGEWHYYTLSGLKKIDPKALVGHVSFYEAAAYAQYKQMRLPTEFEWEVAALKLAWGVRWEWTYSAYLPYPKFKKCEGAVGEYNAKFMINQMVLRGGSVATPKGHSRNTYRNFFHPDERWQFTGIRLVQSI